VTSILILLISFETYELIRGVIVVLLPLNYFVIYCVPEGLWVFSLTLAGKGLYFPLKNKRINLSVLPLVFAIGLEFLQLTPFNKGDFQFLDIVACCIGWIIPQYFFKQIGESEPIIKPFSYKGFLFTLIFSIVYLAHVWS
jgi:hypothetical protein